MKFQSFAMLLAFASHDLIAQSPHFFTLSELKQIILCPDHACVRQLIKAKGYDFKASEEKTANGKPYTTYTYWTLSKGQQPYRPQNIIICTEGAGRTIGFITKDTSFPAWLDEVIKEGGYTLEGDDEPNDNRRYIKKEADIQWRLSRNKPSKTVSTGEITNQISLYASRVKDTPTIRSTSNVLSQDAKPGSIAPNAKVIEADDFSSFNEGYAVIRKGDLMAMIDTKGEIFVPFGKFFFDDVGENILKLNDGSYFHSPKVGFINGYATVVLPGKANQPNYNFINKQGRLAFTRNYYEATSFENGKSLVLIEKGIKGFLNPNGSIFNCKPENVSYKLWQQSNLFAYECNNLSNNPMPQDSDHKLGYVDIQGKIVISCQYNRASPFSEGFASTMKLDKFGESKWSFIDSKGRQITDYMFSSQPKDFHNGLAAVEPRDKSEFDYAYIDRTGKIRIKCKEKASAPLGDHLYYRFGDWVNFKNGYAFWGSVPDSDSWGKIFIDTLGNIHDLTTLKGSFVYNGEKFNGLNKRRFQIYNNSFFQNGDIEIHCYFGQGLANIDGSIVIPPIFKEVNHFDPVSKLAYARYKNDKGEDIEGYINRQGVFQIIKGKGGKW